MASKKKTNQKPAGGLPGLDLTEIERLLAFMDKHNLEQFEFSRGDLRIALKRPGPGYAVPAAPRVESAPALREGAPSPGNAPGGHATAVATKPAAPVEDFHVIKSPIVGTFFAAAGPEAAPFVKSGDRVKAGQVICIVEAMKLMNEIEADVNGVVVRILVENAQPVEYGQPLFAIRPDTQKK